MDAFLDLFSFAGRANRARYFWHVVLDDLVVFTTAATTVFMGAFASLAALPLVGIGLAAAWAALAITVKRLHDLDRPGWHALLFVIPLYNIHLAIVLFVVEGTAGDNQYGPDPLGGVYGGRRQLT